MPGPTALVSVADVKVHLNIPAADTTHDTEIQGFIDAAQPVIENIVGPVIYATWTEWYDGGLPFIELRHGPVISVTSVTEYRGRNAYLLTQLVDPSTATSYSYTIEPEIRRIIRRSSGGTEESFPSGLGTVIVVYVAGRATVPPNVKLAAAELVRHLYQLTQQGGRPAFGGDATEGAWLPAGFAVPTRVLELLAPNRRHPSIG